MSENRSAVYMEQGKRSLSIKFTRDKDGEVDVRVSMEKEGGADSVFVIKRCPDSFLEYLSKFSLWSQGKVEA